MDQPTVSIIIPAYNAEKYIQETLESILAQDYPALEVLVIDDGSIDNTASIVKSFSDDSRVQYIYKTNSGTAKTRNAGIQKASGKFLMFVDSDDILPVGAISILAKELSSLDKAYGLVYGQMERFDDVTYESLGLSPFFPKLTRRKLFTLRTNLLLTSLIRSEVIKKVEGFNESLIFNEDYEMLLRLAKSTRFHSIDQVVYNYRVRANSKTQAGSHKRAVEVTQKRSEYFSNLLKDEDLVTQIQAWGSHYLTAGVEFRNFDKGLSRLYFLTSFFIYPFKLDSLRLLIASLRGRY